MLKLRFKAKVSAFCWFFFFLNNQALFFNSTTNQTNRKCIIFTKFTIKDNSKKKQENKAHEFKPVKISRNKFPPLREMDTLSKFSQHVHNLLDPISFLVNQVHS